MKSTKKRSRKSKLVPRECLDSDDENIADMQNEIEQTIVRMTSSSILKKLNRQTEEPLEFSIKVEVEELDEPVTRIKQETEKELNITIDSVVSLKEPSINNSLKGLDKTSSLAAELSKGPDVLQCIFKEEMIREEFDRISKLTTSKADKLIEIHILNFFGRYLSATDLDDKELQLQMVIGKWKSWQKMNSEHRDVPLSYKCYICSKAWWHYYDFREHFQTHRHADLNIETCGQEAFIVAYHDQQPDYDIPIEENCWQCGQDFTMHRSFKKGNKIYRCKGCLEKFTSCILLNEHLGNCQYFKRTLEIKTNNIFSCHLCPVKYFSETELDGHLTARHTVRSDLPAVINLKSCPTCNKQSIDIHTHECKNLLFKKSCEFCKRTFQKSFNLQMHQSVIKKYYKCAICNKTLLSQCMELEHLLSHSNTYSMIYKCKLCANPMYFLNEIMIKKHRFEIHRRHNMDINVHFFEPIVVPKTLLKMLPLKTYLPKLKTTNGDELQQGLENINACGGLEMEILDFIECDIKENVDKPKGDTVTIKTEAVSTNIDEILPNNKISNIDQLNIKIKTEIPEFLDFNEYSTVLNIKQEPMEVECSIDVDTNNVTVKEEIVENVDVCDLNNIKIEVKDEPVNDNDMINDNDSEKNDSTYTNDNDFKLIYTSKMYSCKKCPYKGIHRHYKQHIKGRCHNSFYTCTKCNSKYQSLKNYLCHFQKHNYVSYTCPKCLKHMPVMSELITHVYQHIKNNFVGVHFIKEKTYNKCFQCRQCRDNVSSSDFFVHWESHIEIKNLGTGSETVMFENEPILQDVIALLQGETPEISKELQPKQCVMCLKNFSRKNDLKRHLIEHLLRDAYTNRDKYECLKCQICSIGFNKIDIYKRHMRDHGSLPLYKCEICDKTFSDSSNFSKHKKVHNLSVLLCDICKKKFTCKTFLIKHMEMHDKLKPISCECCQRVFHSPSLYRKHRNGRYRFKCPACALTFDALKDKWDHMWLAHKERKYLADCPICKKSFRKYQDVKMHIRTTHDSNYVYKPVFMKINRTEEVIVCE